MQQECQAGPPQWRLQMTWKCFFFHLCEEKSSPRECRASFSSISCSLHGWLWLWEVQVIIPVLPQAWGQCDGPSCSHTPECCTRAFIEVLTLTDDQLINEYLISSTCYLPPSLWVRLLFHCSQPCVGFFLRLCNVCVWTHKHDEVMNTFIRPPVWGSAPAALN